MKGNRNQRKAVARLPMVAAPLEDEMSTSSDATFLELASALRAALALEPVSGQLALTPQLAELALRRHRVAPLLHMAGQELGWLNEGSEAQDRLQASYRQGAVEDLKKQATENKLMRILSGEGISFAFIKGRGLSAQLYGDVRVRAAKDIDIIIDPKYCEAAIDLINKSGFLYKPTTITGFKFAAKARQIIDMKIHKDLTFIDNGVRVEIHRRLFRFEPKKMTSDFIHSLNNQIIPLLNNPNYVLYLILHGAISGWHRLRWVADLSLLVRKTEDDVAERLILLSERDYGCLDAVVASLLLVERVFPGSLPALWRDRIAPHQHRNNVRSLHDIFWKTLTAPEPPRHIRSWKNFLATGHADLVFPGRISFAQSKLNRLISLVTIRI